MNIVYTGNGKGKTTAALGLICRNLGHRKKVMLLQFIKTGKSGENDFFSEIYNKDLLVESYGNGFLTDENFELSANLAVCGVKFALEALNDYDLIVLDEINVAVDRGLVDIDSVMKIATTPHKSIVVFTGRNAPDELIKVADIVTEFTEVKHHYHNGVAATEGVEF